MVQWCTVFMPIYQIYRTKRLLTRKSRNHVSERPEFGKINTKIMAISSESLKDIRRPTSYGKGLDNLTSISRSCRIPLSDFEYALKHDAEMLQKFAATEDFSGENISFLIHLTRWKKSWVRHYMGWKTPHPAVSRGISLEMEHY